MKIYKVLFLLLLCSLAFAETNIPSGSVSGIWNSAGSPYIIEGDIELENSDQLVIEAGVNIVFSGNYQFLISGRILADGTQNQNIYFQPSEVGNWKGLRFYNTQTNLQDSCRFNYVNITQSSAIGGAPYYWGGAVYCQNSSDLIFENCSFTNNFSQGSGGAVYLDNSHIIISNSTITDNTSNGAGGAIFLINSNALIENCLIRNNSANFDGGAISCSSSEPIITFCEISNNSAEMNGGGVALYNNSNLLFDRTTITMNHSVIDDSEIAVLYNSELQLNNTVVWDYDFEIGISIANSSSVSATYSVICGAEETDNYFGEGCSNQDPLFLDSENGDYHTTWSNFPEQDETKSPCIDSGDPISIPDEDGTRADIGRYYFGQSGIQGNIILIPADGGDVQDVTISIGDIIAHPDANGDYLLHIEPGTYEISAYLVGYMNDTIEDIVVVEGIVTTGIDLFLNQMIPGLVHGWVSLEGLGNPTQVLISADEDHWTYVVPHPEGLGYEYFLDLSPGTYDLTASMLGYQDSTQTNIHVMSGQTTDGVNFTLDLWLYDGTLDGTVTLFNGTGDVENAIISAGNASTNPDETGHYQLVVPEGIYDVTATMDGYSTDILSNVVCHANQITGDVNLILLNWDLLEGTQFTSSRFITITQSNGDFLLGRDHNQIGVFGPDGSCRGVGFWQPGNTPDWESVWQLPGYWYMTLVSNVENGEELDFKVFSTEIDSNGVIYDCPETMTFVDTTYATEENRIDVTIDTGIETTYYDLQENWNWISTNINIDGETVETLFAPLTPQIYQVKSQYESATYNYPPGNWTGELDILSDSLAYLVKMNSATDDFSISGSRRNPVLTDITIHPGETGSDGEATPGYGWISYYPNTSYPIGFVLQTISGETVAVKSQTQSAINNTEWIGDLEVLHPGIGYKVCVTDTASLVYPPFGTPSPSIREKNNPLSNSPWQIAENYGSNMIFISEIKLNDNKTSNSSNFSAGIFDNENTCRSIGKKYNNFWYFTIQGNLTEDLFLKLSDNNTGKQFRANEKLSFKSDTILGSVEKPKTINIRAEIDEICKPEIYQNFPNPFNPETTIKYFVHKPSKVVCSIFNIKGQKVQSLINKKQEKGYQEIKWNADKLTSGVYFYKLHIDDIELTKKCILLK